jgi:hypothetical protein
MTGEFLTNDSGGDANNSGERTRLACWRRRPAIANSFLPRKMVAARRRNRHERRVRSPGLPPRLTRSPSYAG